MRTAFSSTREASTSALHGCNIGRPRRCCGAVVVRCAKQGGNPFRDVGKGGGGRRDAKKPSSSPRINKQALPVKPQLTISQPLQVTLLEEEDEDEGAAQPANQVSWESFCAALGGEWIGQYGAYTPWEGKSEPVWLDSNNKYIDYVFCRSVEHAGASEGEGPCLVRKIGRAGSLEQVSQLDIPLAGSSVDNDALDVEALSYNSDGVIMFDGGHYSAGPDFIGPPEFKMLKEAEDSGGEDQEGEGEGQEVSDAPSTISIMEQCLVDARSRVRVRVKATVTVSHLDNGEVDLSVLRIVLFREVRAGAVGAASLQLPQALLLPSPCTQLPRPAEAQVVGRWKCVTSSAVSIDQPGPEPGPAEPSSEHAGAGGAGEAGVVWSHSRSTDVQLWELAGRDGPQDGADGGMFWLPGGVLVTFRMFSMEAEDSEDESPAAVNSPKPDAGAGSSLPRGFCMGLTWLHAKGRALQVERYYDEEGCLRDVRFTEAVRVEEGAGGQGEGAAGGVGKA